MAWNKEKGPRNWLGSLIVPDFPGFIQLQGKKKKHSKELKPRKGSTVERKQEKIVESKGKE